MPKRTGIVWQLLCVSFYNKIFNFLSQSNQMPGNFFLIHNRVGQITSLGWKHFYNHYFGCFTPNHTSGSPSRVSLYPSLWSQYATKTHENCSEKKFGNGAWWVWEWFKIPLHWNPYSLAKWPHMPDTVCKNIRSFISNEKKNTKLYKKFIYMFFSFSDRPSQYLSFTDGGNHLIFFFLLTL